MHTLDLEFLKVRIEKTQNLSVEETIATTRSGNQKLVDDIINHKKVTKKIFEQQFNLFVSSTENVALLQPCTQLLFSFGISKDVLSCQKLAFSIHISDNYELFHKIITYYLSFGESFEQLISNDVNWDILKREFSDIQELAKFLEKKLPLTFTEQQEDIDYISTVTQIVFNELKASIIK